MQSATPNLNIPNPRSTFPVVTYLSEGRGLGGQVTAGETARELGVGHGEVEGGAQQPRHVQEARLGLREGEEEGWG